MIFRAIHMHSTVLEAFAIYSKVLFVISLLCMYMYVQPAKYSFILEIQLKYVKFTLKYTACN